MNKSFLANIVLLITANLLIKPLYLFYIDSEVQNVVGSVSYEQFFVFINICYILQFFNDFGIHSYALKEISQQRDVARSLMSSLLGTKLVLSLVFALMACLTWLFFDYDWGILFVGVAVNVFLSSLMLYFRSNLAGLGYFLWDSVISILDKTLLLFVLSYVLYFSSLRSSFGILDFVLYQSFAFIFSILVCLIILGFKGNLYLPSFNRDKIKAVLKDTAPYALIFLLMMIYTRVDAIMLKHLSADSERQIDGLAACFRMFEAGNMFAYLFAGLLLPMSAYLLQQKKDIKPLVWLCTRTMTILVVVVGLSFFFFRTEFLTYLYDRYNPFYDDVLIGLLVSFSCVSIAYIFGSVSVADGRLKPLNILFLGCVLLNILINYLVIPEYGALGASTSSAVTHVISLVGQIIIFQRYLKISWKWYEIWTILLYVLLAVLIFWTINTFISLDWLYLMLLSIISVVLLAFILGIIRWQELTDILVKH